MDHNLSAIKVTVTFYLSAFKNALDNFERNQVPLRTKTPHLRNKMIWKTTSLPSDNLIPSCGVAYLEVKHTPPEISVGNIKARRNFRPVKGQTRSQIVHLYFTVRRACCLR